MLRRNVWLIVLLIFLTGCANMSDSNRTKAQGGGFGALIGAATGALAGQVLGGDTKATLIGAGIGAAVGAGAGYAYGNHVANKKAQYAKEEDYLNACIASARQVNTETRNYNASLRQKINGIDREINYLVAKYNKRQVSKSRLAKEQKKIDSMLATANKKLQRAKDEVGIQKQVLAQSSSTSESARLDSEIKRLEKTVRELEGQTNALAGINQRLSV